MSVIANYSGNVIQAEDASVLLPAYVYHQVTLGTTAGSSTVFFNTASGGTYQVAAVSVIFSTASTSGTVTVNVESGTTAPGSGTAQLTGTMSLAGTANTAVNGTLIASPTTIGANGRVSYTTAGTLTNLAGCVLMVMLKRVS